MPHVSVDVLIANCGSRGCRLWVYVHGNVSRIQKTLLTEESDDVIASSALRGIFTGFALLFLKSPPPCLSRFERRRLLQVAFCRAASRMARKSSFKLAPPTKKPSMSGLANSSCMQTLSEKSNLRNLFKFHF